MIRYLATLLLLVSFAGLASESEGREPWVENDVLKFTPGIENDGKRIVWYDLPSADRIYNKPSEGILTPGPDHDFFDTNVEYQLSREAITTGLWESAICTSGVTALQLAPSKAWGSETGGTNYDDAKMGRSFGVSLGFWSVASGIGVPESESTASCTRADDAFARENACASSFRAHMVGCIVVPDIHKPSWHVIKDG